MITSSVNRVIYKGNGVATEFAYPFKIFDRTDIKVLLVDKDGNRSILTSDYYVDMEAMKVYYPGYAPGAVEPGTEQPAILQEGETLVVYRDVPITQMDRMPENYPFDVNERMHDKSCVIDQQLADAVNRGLSASVDAPEGFVGDVPIVAGKSFRISSDGLRLETTEDPARVLPLAQALLEQTAAAAESAGVSADITQEDVRIVIEIRNTFPLTVATANAALNQTKDDYKGELREAYEAHSNALNQEYVGYTAGLTDKQIEAVGAISEAKGDATGTIAADKTNAVRAVDTAKTDAVGAISVNKSTALSDLDTAKANAIDEVQAAISDVTSDRARAETAANNAQEYKDLAYQYMQGSVNIPVGTILPYASNGDIPVGFLSCNGAAVSKVTYPSLFEVIGYTYGGSGDYFNLPNLNDNRFLEGAGVAGTQKEAGLPNIEGEFQARGHAYNGEYNGALTQGSGAFEHIQRGGGYGDNGVAEGNVSSTNDKMLFDASRSNSIYGKSNTVQPKSLTCIFIIKAFAGASASSSDLAITNLANELHSIIKKTDDGTNIDLGWEYSSGAGAGLGLRGSDNTNAGEFVVFARKDTTENRELRGKPNGSLTWDNKEIERVDSQGDRWFRFESGLQICWADFYVNKDVAGNNYNSFKWTYPMPFADENSPCISANAQHDRFNAGGTAVSSSSCDIYYVNDSSSKWHIDWINVMAIGRWK